MKSSNQHICTINLCEDLFCKWVKNELHKAGVEIDEHAAFSDMLMRYTREIHNESQHIKPLKRWYENKKKCINLSEKKDLVNGELRNREILLEQTAFDGQVLLAYFEKQLITGIQINFLQAFKS